MTTAMEWRAALLLLLLWSGWSWGSTRFESRVVSTPTTLSASKSPYTIVHDILVTDAELHIEAGTELQFAPGTGITVRNKGVLVADGSLIRPVRMVAMKSGGKMPTNRTLRLVDGPSIQEGVVQVLEQGQWRYVCTNSQNWTSYDMSVACRQLGFEGGEWYHWFEHLNDTRQILFQKPDCDGTESSVSSCRGWPRRQMGSGVCDRHPNLGLRCTPFFTQEIAAKGHWRGLRFESAIFSKQLAEENALYVATSRSRLRHVLIEGAGQGLFRGRPNATSAVETWGVPPVMEDVHIRHSAYNALNITNPTSRIELKRLNITHNNGYGLYFNTTKGFVSVQDSLVRDNFGDGIKYFFHDFRPESKKIGGVDIHDFCTYSTTYSQTYPLAMVAEQLADSAVQRKCGKRFYTKHGFLLTLHFVHLVASKNDVSEVQVFDGTDKSARLLATVPVRNFTRPESVVSTSNNMFVVFEAEQNSHTELFLEITAGPNKAVDLNVTNTVVEHNSGRGIWVEWMRSGVHVHRSTIRHHNHVAGLHVSRGAGDVNVTHSVISDNFVDGVNITYGGGNRNISWTELRANIGFGMAVWLNETTVNTPIRQETVVAYSNITLNHDTGLLIGNFCANALVNISGNHFSSGKHHGLEVLSCWSDKSEVSLTGVRDEDALTELQIGHNHFVNHERVAIRLSPLSRIRGRIEHNDCLDNLQGCLYTRNEDDFVLEKQIIDLIIFENRFLRNQGPFVLHLGMSHRNFLATQRILMRFNWVLNNKIEEPYKGLNARSKMAAVVVIESSNVRIERNLIDNPDSSYELGSQLIEPSVEIDARHNWLGDKNERRVWNRVFDRDDRYNLAKIVYVPYLLSNNINTELLLEVPVFEPPFVEARNIGGEVLGVEELRSDGIYYVKRDIHVRPNGRLKIAPGVTLKFEHGVGMMVSGELIAEGDLSGNTPLLTLLDQPVQQVEIPRVRLVGGRTPMEGRLQVRLRSEFDENEPHKDNDKSGKEEDENDWGTVCSFGFTIESASVACNQMGYVLNPFDWRLTPRSMPGAGAAVPIIMSNVRCDDHLETDLTACKLAETNRDRLLNSCSHADDVGLRCYPLSWSGVRLGMTAKRSKLFDVRIERAGLYDHRRREFSPALRADLSHHVFDHLDVSNNDFDGLGVFYSDIYFPDRVNVISNSRIQHNKGHGLSFRQLGMLVENCDISNNERAGVHQDPRLDKLEQRELADWMLLLAEREDNAVITLPESRLGENPNDPIVIPEGQQRLIVTKATNESIRRTYHIRCERDEFVIGLQLLNPFHNYTSEQMLIYDFREIRQNDDFIHVWNVSRDLVSFPTISSSYAITLDFSTGSTSLGSLMLLLTPINCVNLPGNCNTRAYHINPLERNKIVPGSFARLTLHKTKIENNYQGLSILHYNRDLGHNSEVYLRKANESIEIVHSSIINNRAEALHLFTPFAELGQHNLTETTLSMNFSRLINNGKGVLQEGRDLRDSNNIYHWVFRENVIKNNRYGGIDLALPYVWQYNENITHTVHLDSNDIRSNTDFGIDISGHFARVFVFNNSLVGNQCLKGLMALRGMEKESWIYANNMRDNLASFVAEMDMDSQSEIMGFVEAYFSHNILQNNAPKSKFRRKTSFFHAPIEQVSTYTLGIRGVQKFNVTTNLFSNPEMEYELVAGVRTARISNYLNAERNFWGTDDLNAIRERIFDFDDHNAFAITHFAPYLTANTFDSALSPIFVEEPRVHHERLGGQLTQDLYLRARYRPYEIKADLTIMPDAHLTIEPGTILEFAPSVGILVLGRLTAQGSIDRPIVMRPLGRREDQRFSHRQLNQAAKMTYRLSDEEDFDVRLCTADETGSVCPSNATQGFVEIFNRTTLQWVPICDTRFTERNAEVVCKNLGHSNLNVHLDFGQRIEYNALSLTRIIFWPEPLQCTGREERLSHCPLRMSGYFDDSDNHCNWEAPNFAFVHCGEPNLDLEHQDYWGGIRFSVKEFEPELFHARIHDAVNHATEEDKESVLEYVEIMGAGILHGEKAPAVQSVLRSPLLSSLNITRCAWDGINLISPSKTMNMLYNKIWKNLGVAISAAQLTGEVREAELSAFVPLQNIRIPYNNFGVVDICDPQKEIIIEERILLVYKYDNKPVDCVKIFGSIYDVKPIGLRLLQFNLVNSTNQPWVPDHLALFDGDLYNRTIEPIVTIQMDNEDVSRRLHRTRNTNVMSVRFHATGGRATLGFVAEVVTLPVSIVGMDRYVRHNMSFSVFEENAEGAIHYASAGETNPIITVQRNQIVGNNVNAMYGNFSAAVAAVTLDVQNTQDVFFHNNLVARNVGGLFVRSGSSTTATAMRALLHNNVFDSNQKRVTLRLEGRQTSPYEQVTMYRNYITRSDVAHEPVMRVFQVVCNVSYTTLSHNKGKSIVEVMGFDNVRLPIYQSFTHNGFYNNIAYGLHCQETTLGRCRWGERATVVAGSAGQEYVDNIFYNRDNDYELITMERQLHDVYKTPINAKYNYWAYNETFAVAGRIRDLHDRDGLLEVDFTPFQMNNKTLLSGKCQPGWTLLGDTCYLYAGGPMRYNEAVQFCAADNATMPAITSFYEYHRLLRFLEREQEDWRYYDMVWIKDLDTDGCSVFVDAQVRSVSCDFLLPTLCEKDEHVRLRAPVTVAELPKEAIYSIIALCLGILLCCCTATCWCRKNNARRKERFQRRTSIRLSKTSLASRSMASMASTAAFTDVNYRRRYMTPSGSKPEMLSGSGPATMASTVLFDTSTMDPKNSRNNNVSSTLLADSGLQASFDFFEPNRNSNLVRSSAAVHTDYDNAAFEAAANQNGLPQNNNNFSNTNNNMFGNNVFNASEPSGNRTEELRHRLASSGFEPSHLQPEQQSSMDTETESSTDPSQSAHSENNNAYQSMYESSTFRPSFNTAVPQVPAKSSSSNSSATSSPRRPFEPPPPPPQAPPRANSVAQMLLETNLDDNEEDDEEEEEDLQRRRRTMARSLPGETEGGKASNLYDSLLETDM